MDEHKNITQDKEAEMEAMYLALLSRLVELFDSEPFRLPKTKRPSRPLYDALMIALSLSADIDLEAKSKSVRESLVAALSNEATYDILVGRGNTIESIRQRVELASQILNA